MGFFTLNNYFRLFFLLVFGLVLCSLSFSQINAEQGEPVNVSKSNGKSDLAQLSLLNNNIYVVWRDNSTGNDDIYFAKSFDNGLGFYEHVNLSNNPGTSAFPRMAIVEDNVYATWYDYTPGQSDIFFAKSADNGDSFKTINLSDNGGVSYNPWVATSENNVYVVWNDETPQLKNLKITKPENVDIALGTLDILLATSHDGGFTFEVSNLSESDENSLNPRITVNENNVYVAWTEITKNSDEIFFAVSSDNDNSFSDPINVSRTSGVSRDAAIEVSGNYVYIIWQESVSGRGEIFFTKSENNGISFTDPIIISNGGAAELARDTQMVVLDGNVYVVWFDRSPQGGIFFVKSNDHGSSFGKPVNLSGKVPGVAKAQIALYQNNLYVIWQDYRFGNFEVFLRSSIDKGQSFGSIINVSKDRLESNLFILGPQIASNEQKVYTIFEKINQSGSDLFLVTISNKEQLQMGSLILQTMDEQINVEASFDKEPIDIDEPVNLNLKFFNASTKKLLNQVNYSLKIDEVQGNNTLARTNLFAENGEDNQTLTFDRTGPYTITISISEIEGSPVQDSDFSSSTDGIITVVPEFPLGTLIVIIIGLGISLILKKSSFLITNKMVSN